MHRAFAGGAVKRDEGWRTAGARLQRLMADGRLDMPNPGGGHTPERLRALAELGAEDLSVARLAEGHLDALAILAVGGCQPVAGGLYGVWAAEAPGHTVGATCSQTGWRLEGTKQFCSGARVLSLALVTAMASDGPRLFAVDLHAPGVTPVPDTWPSVGMADSDSLDVQFDGVPVTPDAAIGPAGFYTGRPGFWFGAIGVAACWYGGARALVDGMVSHLHAAEPDGYQLAQLGAAVARLDSLWRTLEWAGRAIDDSPTDLAGAERLALGVRQTVEAGCTDILAAAAEAGGPRLLALDRGQSRTTADLLVYLSQHHRQRDAAALGRLVLKAAAGT